MPKQDKEYPTYSVDVISRSVLPDHENPSIDICNKLATVKWFHSYTSYQLRKSKKAAFDFAKSLYLNGGTRVFVVTQFQRKGTTVLIYKEVTN